MNRARILHTLVKKIGLDLLGLLEKNLLWISTIICLEIYCEKRKVESKSYKLVKVYVVGAFRLAQARSLSINIWNLTLLLYFGDQNLVQVNASLDNNQTVW